MPKFFVNKENIKDTKVILTGDDIKHITKVLRKQVGDKIEVSDGEGNKYLTEISKISKEEIVSEIVESFKENDTSINITLFQSLPKSTKMDVIIQKCTELGVNKIVPFISHRTVVEIKDKKSEKKKLERWQKIAVEASKQCQRAIIPKVTEIFEWKQVLNEIDKYDLALMAYENEVANLKDVLGKNNNAKNICIIIGPEGGFEEDEVKEICNVGVSSITLGNRILRTETAGMALLSIIMYEFNEMNK